MPNRVMLVEKPDTTNVDSYNLGRAKITKPNKEKLKIKTFY